jgi:hypothetical protein
MTSTLHEDKYTFLIISHSIYLRMRNVTAKICRESHNTHFMLTTFFPENHAAYEIMWENIAGPGWPQMAIWRTRIACWITKATDTHSAYVTFIAFPLQQWLNGRASMLRYTYVACLLV